MVTHRELVADIWEDIFLSAHVSEEDVIRVPLEEKWGKLSDKKYNLAKAQVINIIAKKAGY